MAGSVGAMQLKRADNGVVFASDGEVSCWEEWKLNFPDPVILTVNHVPYFQKRGRGYWTIPITVSFCDDLPNAKVAKMRAIQRAARNRIWFRFTDRQGDTYLVRLVIVGKPERAQNSPYNPFYYLDIDLYMEGYE
jgi:hypothetical protein